MDNKQFPERDEENMTMEELTFDSREEETPLTGTEEIPEFQEETPLTEAEEIPAFQEETPMAEAEEIPIFREGVFMDPEGEEEGVLPAEDFPEVTEEPVTWEFPEDEVQAAQEEALAQARMPESFPAAEVPDEGPAAHVADLGQVESTDIQDSAREEDASDSEEILLSHGLTEPVVGSEIAPDSHAMDYHGMLGHDEEEPPFDLSILEDPMLFGEEEQPAPEPEAPEEQEEEIREEYRDEDFDALLNAPEPEQKIPSHNRPARKGRPKKKTGEGFFGIPNILTTFVWLGLILAIGVTLGRMLWLCAADVLAFGREDQPVTVTIYEADTMEDITNKLYDAGLIRYKSLFSLYASISDAEEDIDPGIYDLNTRYDYHALVNMMSSRSTREAVRVTIPEGYTCRQIFALLEENKICTAVDLGAYAADGELEDYWFLENVERGQEYCLEGFLFPDTYEFYKNDSPKNILTKMLDNFDTRFSDEMRAQLDTLNANVTDGTFTVREVTIVASMIEKETAASSESPRIAGVIYNRLFNWEYPALLNIDASIIYAQGGDSSKIDTSIDSPYNTYLNEGLTPTPISNPGLASLEAALNPESHNYYYYVLDPSTGVHQFSATQEEHDNWVTQFAAQSE